RREPRPAELADVAVRRTRAVDHRVRRADLPRVVGPGLVGAEEPLRPVGVALRADARADRDRTRAGRPPGRALEHEPGAKLPGEHGAGPGVPTQRIDTSLGIEERKR